MSVVSPKSVRKKRSGHKKPGVPYPNYFLSKGETPVVCTCVYDGKNFFVHCQTDIHTLYNNGAFGRSTLTLRTPLNVSNFNYQLQPYYQKSQQVPKIVITENFQVPVVNSTVDSKDNVEPPPKKQKLVQDLCDSVNLSNGVGLNESNMVDESDLTNGNDPVEDLNNPKMDPVPMTLNGITDNNSGIKSTNMKDENLWKKRDDEKLELLPEEAVFLAFALGCLKVKNEEGEDISCQSLWEMLLEKDPEFPIFYAVYHYFRCKNWVPKNGHNYGGDFVLYETGPEFYHSLYVVHILGLNSRPKPLMMEVAAWQRCASHSSKYALLCEVKFPDKFSPATPKCIFDLNIEELPIYRWAPHLYEK